MVGFNTKEIWRPFMTFNGWNFNLGLVISSFSYYKVSRTGSLVVLIGTLVTWMGNEWFNVFGYMILTVGFI